MRLFWKLKIDRRSDDDSLMHRYQGMIFEKLDSERLLEIVELSVDMKRFTISVIIGRISSDTCFRRKIGMEV